MTLPEDRDLMRADAYAAHLGIEITSVEEGAASARMEVRPEHFNFLGMVHGGAIFSLADVAFSAAANSEGHRAMAIHITIDYLRATGETSWLEAEVRMAARAGRAKHYEMKVKGDSGQVVAVLSAWAYHTDRPLA